MAVLVNFLAIEKTGFPIPSHNLLNTLSLMRYVSDNSNTRRAILLSLCGAPTYQLIRNLAAPGKPTDKSSQLQIQKSSSMVCYRCGGKHKVTDCKFQEVECHNYKKKGHIFQYCQNEQRLQKSQNSSTP